MTPWFMTPSSCCVRAVVFAENVFSLSSVFLQRSFGNISDVSSRLGSLVRVNKVVFVHCWKKVVKWAHTCFVSEREWNIFLKKISPLWFLLRLTTNLKKKKHNKILWIADAVNTRRLFSSHFFFHGNRTNFRPEPGDDTSFPLAVCYSAELRMNAKMFLSLVGLNLFV